MAALDRQVDVLAEVVFAGHHLQHLVGHVLRMRGGEAHAQIGIHVGDQVHQLGEADDRLPFVLDVALGVDVPLVAVHVLAEQGHLAVALGKQVAGLGHDALRVAAPLPAPGERHHAEAAHVVAAPHDGDEGRHPLVVEADRLDLGVGLLPAEQGVDRLLPALDLVDEARQIAIGVRADHQVHQLLLFEQLVPQALGHAAEDAHLELGVVALAAFEVLQPVADPLLGIVPDRAGVEQNQIGLAFVLRRSVAGLGEDARDDFTVAEVHLATVALEVQLAFAHGAGLQGLALAGFVDGVVAWSHGVRTGEGKFTPNLTTCQSPKLFCRRTYGRSDCTHKMTDNCAPGVPSHWESRFLCRSFFSS